MNVPDGLSQSLWRKYGVDCPSIQRLKTETNSLSLSSTIFQHNQADQALEGDCFCIRRKDLWIQIYSSTVLWREYCPLLKMAAVSCQEGPDNIVSLREYYRDFPEPCLKRRYRCLSRKWQFSGLLDGGQNLYDIFLQDKRNQPLSFYLPDRPSPNACIHLEALVILLTNKKPRSPSGASVWIFLDCNPRTSKNFVCLPMDSMAGNSKIWTPTAHWFFHWHPRIIKSLWKPDGRRQPQSVSYTADSLTWFWRSLRKSSGTSFLGWYDDPFNSEQIEIISRAQNTTPSMQMEATNYGVQYSSTSRKRFPFIPVKRNS